MRRFFVFIFILFFLPVFSETLTLEMAVKKALENNPDYKALKLRLKASEYGVKASKALKFGELDLNAGYKKTEDENIVRPMTRELILSGLENMPFDNEYFYWSFDYKLPIYSGGKIKAGEEIASVKKKTIYYRLKRLEWNLRFGVVKSFLGIISVDSQIDSLNSYLTSLKSLRKHIQLGIESGKFAEIDLYKVDYQIEDAKYRIESLKEQKVMLTESLSSLLGVEDLSSFKLQAEELLEPELNLPDVNVLVERAKKERSDVFVSETDAKIKELSVRIAKSEWKPKVSLNANLMGVDASNINYSDNFWSVSANISIPIFDMGRRKKKVKQAEKEFHSAKQKVYGVELTIKKEVKTAYYNVRKEFLNYKTALSSLRLQREIERIEQLKYENGRGDIDDLLMAKARREISEANVIKTKYNFYIAREELKKSIEGDLK